MLRDVDIVRIGWEGCVRWFTASSVGNVKLMGEPTSILVEEEKGAGEVWL